MHAAMAEHLFFTLQGAKIPLAYPAMHGRHDTSQWYAK